MATMSNGSNGTQEDERTEAAEKKLDPTSYKKQKVEFYKLFSFANGWDYLLMAIGLVGACAHGASVPIWFIFFGKLINCLGLAYLDPLVVSSQVAYVHGTLKTKNSFTSPFRKICTNCNKQIPDNLADCIICKQNTPFKPEHCLECALETEDGVFTCAMKFPQLQQSFLAVTSTTHEQYRNNI